MKQTQRFLSSNWPVLTIIVVGFLMRIIGLSYQSFWLDELHTMNETSPAVSWGELFRLLKCCDQHPPLFFILEKTAFLLFGQSEFVARFIPMLAGTASILAMYLLGKEMLNKRLGHIAALLTCINFYNLEYSQEARGYIFAFLFVALSYLFFIKLIRAPKKKNAIWYGVFTLLLLYSHYYGLFILGSQAVCGIFFIAQERGSELKRMIKWSALSVGIVIVGYLPILPFLLAISGIKSFWIGATDPAFIQNYFSDFFGDSSVLMLILSGLLIVFITRVSFEGKNQLPIKSNPHLFAFIIVVSWIFITVLAPYLRSLLVIPMLYPRYTIIILPALLVAIAYGIELFENNLVKWSIVSLIVIFSLVNIFAEKKYYTTPSKTQFREMTAFIVEENKEGYPIINQLSLWHQQYYLSKRGSKAITIGGDKQLIIDSILSGKVSYAEKGFWLAGAHGDKQITEELSKSLDTAYLLLKQKDFMDAWARLYVSRKHLTGSNFILGEKDFGDAYIMEDRSVAIWNGAIQSRAIRMEPGNHTITIIARGDPGKNTYPHLNLFVNQQKIGDYFVGADFETTSYSFVNVASTDAVIRIEMDNDFSAAGLGDRNAFVKTVVVSKDQ